MGYFDGSLWVISNRPEAQTLRHDPDQIREINAYTIENELIDDTLRGSQLFERSRLGGGYDIISTMTMANCRATMACCLRRLPR